MLTRAGQCGISVLVSAGNCPMCALVRGWPLPCPCAGHSWPPPGPELAGWPWRARPPVAALGQAAAACTSCEESAATQGTDALAAAARSGLWGQTLVGLAVCSTIVADGWSQDPASCSPIIILLTMACTCGPGHSSGQRRLRALQAAGSWPASHAGAGAARRGRRGGAQTAAGQACRPSGPLHAGQL